MLLERVVGCKHARIHAKPNDIAGCAANLKVRPTGNMKKMLQPTIFDALTNKTNIR